jgi:hypothetical protein
MSKAIEYVSGKRRTAMKKVNVVLAAVFAMGMLAQGTVLAQQNADSVKIAAGKDDLFAGTEIFAKNATDVTEITMDPDTLTMVGGKDKDKAHDMVLQVVRTYEYDKPGMYNMADVDKYREKLNTGDWHCSIHTRNMKTGESTDMCNKRRTDDLHESAIITVEPKELTFIHTISHHGNMMGMPGMGDMGMGYGIGVGTGVGLGTSMATLNPEMLELRMQLNSLKSGMALHMPLVIDMEGMPQIDSEEIQKAIEKSQKEWGKDGKKMKEFMSPDGHNFFVAPAAPEAPEVVPDPASVAPKIVPDPAPAAPAEPATPAPVPAPKAMAAPAPMPLVVPAFQM